MCIRDSFNGLSKWWGKGGYRWWLVQNNLRVWKGEKMSKNILVVDDEKDIRDSIGIYLKSEGYNIYLSLIHI